MWFIIYINDNLYFASYSITVIAAWIVCNLIMITLNNVILFMHFDFLIGYAIN